MITAALLVPALVGPMLAGQNRKRMYGYGGYPYAQVVVDGRAIPERGLLREGRVQLPMRAIFERLGAVVRWIPASRKVVGMTRMKTVSLVVGENFGYMPEATYLDFPPRIVRGRIYVPVRFCAEALDSYVKWDYRRRTAYVYTNNPGTPGVKI